MLIRAWQTVETESLLKPIISAEEVPGEDSINAIHLLFGLEWCYFLLFLWVHLCFPLMMGSVCAWDL